MTTAAISHGRRSHRALEMVANGPEGCLESLPKFIVTLSNSIERYFYFDCFILYGKKVNELRSFSLVPTDNTVLTHK